MSDEQKIRSYVGRNADYYVDTWKRFQREPGTYASFNAAAFFGNVIWLAYRRLYAALFWMTVVAFVDVSLVLYVEAYELVPAILLAVWNLLFAVVYVVTVGLFGNYWYWRKFRKQVARAEKKYFESHNQLRFLETAGGPGPVAASLVLLVMLFPVAWASYHASRVVDTNYVFGATGPLTVAEVRANFIDRLEFEDDEELACVLREVEKRAAAAGDPETLDPSTVEMLPEKHWNLLDADDKRLILSQAIVTKASFECN